MSGVVLRIIVALAAAFACVAPLHAEAAKPKPEWNQTDNVKDAAKRLGELHRRKGAQGALKFLEACYKTHTLAERFTQGLEACMAQDYMLSQVLAVIYSRVPEEKLKQMKVPTAAIIARAMQGRFQAIFQQYQVTQQQAEGLKDAVDKHGMPVFVKAVFPKRGKSATGSKPGSTDGAASPPPVHLPPPETQPEKGDVPPAEPAPAGEPK